MEVSKNENDINMKKNEEEFRINLTNFLTKNIEKIHPKIICACLIFETRIISCSYFNNYQYMLGYLTKLFNQDLEELFYQISEHLEKKEEEIEKE